MKPAPIRLQPPQAQRIAPELAASLVGVGNAGLLAEPLLGLVASRECPGCVLIETLDRVPGWVTAQLCCTAMIPTDRRSVRA